MLHGGRLLRMQRASSGTLAAATGPPLAGPAPQVCVIDSGFRTTHQDLLPNFAAGWNR